MVNGVTKLENLINPQVMKDMISAKLPKALRFAPLATIETKLVGQPGSELTVPVYTYIGPATDIAEGEAIPTDKLGVTTKKMTIKKVGKAVEITDEAVLSGLGNPVDEAANQLLMAIADKLDDDVIAEAKKATQRIQKAPVTVEVLQEAVDLFDDEEDVQYVAILSPADASAIRKNAAKNWLNATELGANVVLRGTLGEIDGVQIVRSKKVEKGKGFIVQITSEPVETDDEQRYGAFVITMKRDTSIETDRDILKGTTVVAGNKHYGVFLYNDKKVVRFGTD